MTKTLPSLLLLIGSILLGQSCQSDDPMDIRPPDLSIDWQQHVFKDVRPVDESDYPVCDSLPVINNPEHPESYDFLGTQGQAILAVFFQSENPYYAIYSRSTPLNGNVGPDIVEVILLNLKTGETKVLGETTGSPHIGGDYVIFPNRYEFVVYQISIGRYERKEGDIYKIGISPKGGYVSFLSNSNTGDFDKYGCFIYETKSWQRIFETTIDSIYHTRWLSENELVFTRFQQTSIFSLKMSDMKTTVFMGPFSKHFAVFSGLSKDLKYAYGYKTYVRDLEKDEALHFQKTYDGESCQTRDYGSIYPLPDGRLLVARYYYLVDHDDKTVSVLEKMRLFDADGTNERAVTLLLK